MEIIQGNICWVNFFPTVGSELVGKHPALVIQSTSINKTRIKTTVVLGLTSNIKLARIKGNVLISPDHMNGLEKETVVNVSQVFTIDKSRLGDKVGSISKEKLQQVFQGIDYLFGRF